MKNLILIILPILAFVYQIKQDIKEHQKQVIENYIKSYNDFDSSGMTKSLTDNVIFENISNGNLNFRTEWNKEFSKQAESAKQYFKNRKQIIEVWDFNNSKAVLAIEFI